MFLSSFKTKPPYQFLSLDCESAVCVRATNSACNMGYSLGLTEVWSKACIFWLSGS